MFASLQVNDIVISISGLLAIAFEFFPYLNTWYAGKSVEYKRQLMLLMVLGVALIVASYEWMILDVPLNFKSLVDFAVTAFLALGVNQGTYKLTKSGN